MAPSASRRLRRRSKRRSDCLQLWRPRWPFDSEWFLKCAKGSQSFLHPTACEDAEGLASGRPRSATRMNWPRGPFHCMGFSDLRFGTRWPSRCVSAVEERDALERQSAVPAGEAFLPKEGLPSTSEDLRFSAAASRTSRKTLVAFSRRPTALPGLVPERPLSGERFYSARVLSPSFDEGACMHTQSLHAAL